MFFFYTTIVKISNGKYIISCENSKHRGQSERTRKNNKKTAAEYNEQTPTNANEFSCFFQIQRSYVPSLSLNLCLSFLQREEANSVCIAVRVREETVTIRCLVARICEWSAVLFSASCRQYYNTIISSIWFFFCFFFLLFCFLVFINIVPLFVLATLSACLCCWLKMRWQISGNDYRMLPPANMMLVACVNVLCVYALAFGWQRACRLYMYSDVV